MTLKNQDNRNCLGLQFHTSDNGFSTKEIPPMAEFW